MGMKMLPSFIVFGAGTMSREIGAEELDNSKKRLLGD